MTMVGTAHLVEREGNHQDAFGCGGVLNLKDGEAGRRLRRTVTSSQNRRIPREGL